MGALGSNKASLLVARLRLFLIQIVSSIFYNASTVSSGTMPVSQSPLVNRIFHFCYVRRRVSIRRLFIVFFLVTFFLTAYLYDLVQIDSRRVVIHIMPGGVGSEERLVADKQSFDNYATVKKKAPSLFDRPYKMNSDIVEFIAQIDQSVSSIVRNLRKSEQEQVKRLRLSYENQTQDLVLIEQEIEKILENKNDEKTVDKKPVDEEYEKDKHTSTRSTVLIEKVPRADLVKFLKYEKVKLKFKTIRTVKSVLEELKLKDELDLSKLPSIWEKYYVKINELKLYDNPLVIDQVLDSIAKSPVISASEKEKGTQIKLMLVLSNDIEVLIKPMKVPRDYETPPDHFYFVDFERHHAEIAAFHVDKLLGFYRVPPTVGRTFNITKDLWDKADEDLAKTFFYSPGGNTCFTGHCSYYCDSTHATCGKPKDKLEASVQIYLPSKPIVKWKATVHPYRRTYTKKKKAEWETNERYCEEKLFQDMTYHSKLLLDIMDLSIFDFITGNMDRHHYERMVTLSDQSFIIHIDNGRSFGKAFHDEMSILAPLRQCCFVRYTTYERIKWLYQTQFSKLLNKSLKSDPIFPVLTDDHLRAVDRRLEIIFRELMNCTRRFPADQVIVDDGY